MWGVMKSGIPSYPYDQMGSISNNNNGSGGISMMMMMMSPEARALAACKSHSEAERRRRKRINAHLATLRSLLPNLLKTDKASVLGEAVRRVRELKKTTAELMTPPTTSSPDCECDGDGDAMSVLLPGDTDEVRLCRSQNDSCVVIATLCCEDRPDLIFDVTRALKTVKARLVRAEIATVGGRTKTVLWVHGGQSGGAGLEGALRRVLKVVVDKPSGSSGPPAHGLTGFKRQRLYL